ncbi:uncharacterized protein HaLaN_26995 [Haematococcus lacustris]|uniref:Uncharacterized protein n=1 Tax=Haematococcus lacustris TaxID=44745 RepID=A0A6A0A8F4_HAELA|nr:uncharacterized protein HaLaN_26995 [Haematococcus lacustris]
MAAVMTYRANRDRVIMMGMSLHEHAMALCKHCPEFTLTYPDYNPANRWEGAIATVDEDVSDRLL